jgi:hypothetical protein
MTANAGYHAYATGDVLTAAQVQYNLQNQTVMYFATTTARDAALTGSILVDGMVAYTPATGLMYYNGTAWTAVSGAASPLTTKGDLYTYSTTNARLAIGSDGQTLVANSANATGLGWQAPVQQNPVLNSAFQVWQRGTSISLAASTALASGYTADRWQTSTAANQAITVARQATSDTTNLPNIQYCMRYQRNSGQTGVTQLTVAQSFESVNSIPLAGKTITVSFYARAGANYSSASNALGMFVYSGTGSDQNVLAGYTGFNNVMSNTATLTTTWQRFSYSATVPTTATELGFGFYYTPVGTAGTNDYYEITGVQLEVGSVATPFHTFSTTLQGELAACQRYYWRAVTLGGSAYPMFTRQTAAYSTTLCSCYVVAPVSMRIQPTSVDYSTLALTPYGGTGTIALTALAMATDSSSTNIISVLATVASGLTTGTTYNLVGNNSTSAYLGLNAEL